MSGESASLVALQEMAVHLHPLSSVWRGPATGGPESAQGTDLGSGLGLGQRLDELQWQRSVRMPRVAAVGAVLTLTRWRWPHTIA